MKTKQLLFALFVGMAISATACKPCKTCVYQQTGDEVEVCKNAYAVPGMYKAQIESYEDSGYKCN